MIIYKYKSLLISYCTSCPDLMESISNWGIPTELLRIKIKQYIQSISHNLEVIQSISHNQEVNLSISQSINQSVNQPVSPSINLSINQSISHSINPSIKQSVNQSLQNLRNHSCGQRIIWIVKLRNQPYQ